MKRSLRRAFAQFAFALCLAVPLAFVWGCSGTGKGDVSGKVTVRNQLLPRGRITFQSQVGNNEVFDAAITDGSYSMPGVPPGPVKITVESFRPPARASVKMPKDLGIKPKEGAEKVAGGGKYVPINPRYSDVERSGLTYNVTAGAQTKSFDLDP